MSKSALAELAGETGAPVRGVALQTRTRSASRPAPPEMVKRARAALVSKASAVSGEHGSDATFDAARYLHKRFGLNEEQVFQVLWEDFNPRCEPPWEERDLRRKANEAVNKSWAGVSIEDEERWLMSYEQEAAPKVDQEPVTLRRLGELLEPALERAEKRRSGDEKPVPVPFPQYAEILRGGYWPGVHSLIASTGAGKSAFMFQVASHAAQAGVPVLYIGLELSETQVALRALGEQSKVSWSSMYTGEVSPAALERARLAVPALAELPFYIETGEAHGWAPSNLVRLAKAIRQAHPNGPFLAVLDFLQLVSGEAGESVELRERIARASYAAVSIANSYDASVVLVSSAARDKYGLLGGDVKGAGFSTRVAPGKSAPQRTILNPGSLVGIGKESGEIEYAVESQTVLVRWPTPLENGETAVVCAVPKLRYGPPSWVGMSFHQRFEELPFKDIGDFPEVTGRGGKGSAVAGGELRERLLETVRRHPELGSKTQVVKATTGTKAELLEAFDRLVTDGVLLATEKGFVVRDEENL